METTSYRESLNDRNRAKLDVICALWDMKDELLSMTRHRRGIARYLELGRKYEDLKLRVLRKSILEPAYFIRLEGFEKKLNKKFMNYIEAR